MRGRALKATRVTWVGFFANIILVLVKLLAGLYGRSSAMVADAFHSISDLGTDIVVLLSFRIIDKPEDRRHNYGHGKVETLVTVIIGVVLLAVGLRISWSGIYRVFQFYRGLPIPQPGLIAFYAAIISVGAKEWLYRLTVKEGREIDSRAVIANAWHHRSDAFSSVGVMLGIGGAIIFGEKWRVLDPLAAILVSFFIVKTAILISIDGVNELIEVSLDDGTESKILDIVNSVDGVELPHNLRTRRIGSHIAIEIHIKVDKDLNITQGHAISTSVEDKIRQAFKDKVFISIHIEPI